MIKIGIIGLGFMGYTHFDIFKEHPLACVTAICDRQLSRLQGGLARY